MPAAAQDVSAGTIEGRVVMREQKSGLARAAYLAGGVARRVEPLPAVAMLSGRIPGDGAAARDIRIVQRDTAFVPGIVVVTQGTAVAFPNEDPFFHNVFSYSRPRRFDLGRYPRGESKTVRFDSPGVIKIFCEIHNWMRGAIVVTENPFHSLVADDGSFTIRGVPPGRYKLRVWHFDRGEKTVDVVVPDGATARVDVSL